MSAIFDLKYLRFELEYISCCSVLPVLATLQALDTVQLNYMRVQRKKSVADKANFAALGKLPENTVPKLTADNYDIFTTAFCSVVARTIGMIGILVDCDMRGVTSNYDSPWTNREDKIKNCLLHTGDCFKNYNITLYSLYSQYIGTKSVSYNIIDKCHSINNGCKHHQYFELHFWNDSYITNKATYATSNMNIAVYNDDRRNYTLENYYMIMLESFNYLAAARSACVLNDTKKINSFEQGLKDPQAIHWCIISIERWDNFPPVDQTFDIFYNKFSKYISKYKTLLSGSRRSSRIGTFNTQGGGGY